MAGRPSRENPAGVPHCASPPPAGRPINCSRNRAKARQLNVSQAETRPTRTLGFPRAAMAVTRFLRIFFGLIASAMLVAGLGDVLLHGQLTLVPRPVFAALIGVVIVFILHGYLRARQRSELLDRQAAQ